MTKQEKVNEWLKRSKSNLSRAKNGKSNPDILLEDLCFDIQQSVEKVFKALCINFDVIFPKTHNIEYLIELLEKKGISIPNEINRSKILTEYAIETRYPGDYEPVTQNDYNEALQIGEAVIKWAIDILEQPKLF